MHPDLLNNSLFLRYYNQWQEDPASIVFAPIAEYLLAYGLAADAIKVCHEGLKHHPQSISGRLALAKAYFREKEWALSKEQLKLVLNAIPAQEKALELWEKLERELVPPAVEALKEAEAPKKVSSWETLTMAKIFAAQGHVEKARQVYEAILKREPANEEAKKGLTVLENEG